MKIFEICKKLFEKLGLPCNKTYQKKKPAKTVFLKSYL